MADEIEFDRTATTPAGEVATLSPLVRRVIAGNGGPMTFTGTCTYIVGRGTVAIIDPGPDDSAHVERLLGATTADVILELVDTDEPPLRLFLGTYPYPVVEAAYRKRLDTWNTWRPLADKA